MVAADFCSSTAILLNPVMDWVAGISFSMPGLLVDSGLAHLANGFQRIARALFRHNPILFRIQDLKQPLLVLGAGHRLVEVFLVAAVVERLAGLSMELLAGVAANLAIEFNVGHIQGGFARLENIVQ